MSGSHSSSGFITKVFASLDHSKSTDVAGSMVVATTVRSRIIALENSTSIA